MFKRIIILAFLTPFFWQLSGCSCSKRPTPPLPTEPGLYIYPGELETVSSGSFINPNVIEGQSGTAELFFTVWLEPRYVDAVTVDYEYVIPTAPALDVATAGTDFEAVTSGTLTFEPGEQKKTISVQIKGDTLYERNENVELKILNSSGPVIRFATAKGVIVNDDHAPVASIALAEGETASVAESDGVVANESGELKNFVVTLDQISGVDARLNIIWPVPDSIFRDNKAAFMADYVLYDQSNTQIYSSNIISIPAGETSTSVKLRVVDDGLVEGAESFYIGIRAMTAADNPNITDVIAHTTNRRVDMEVAASDTSEALRARKLNDTGITLVQATVGVGDVSLQQDAHQGRDADGTLVKADLGGGPAGFDFTRLDSNGVALPDQNITWKTDDPTTWWRCVRDNNTGLVWEVKSPDQNSLSWVSVTLPWFDPNSETNGGDQGSSIGEICSTGAASGVICNTLYYSSQMNIDKLCGMTGWRVPALEELRGIIDYGNGGVPVDYFPDLVLGGRYWTSTTSPEAAGSALSFVLQGADNPIEESRSKDTWESMGVILVNSGSAQP